jgi:hypothetical protein
VALINYLEEREVHEETSNAHRLNRVCILIAVSLKIVIPAKAGIQSFQKSLDAGSSPA